MQQPSIHLNEIEERAAYQAIETAVIEYFQLRDCIVNLDTHCVCVLFDPVAHHKWIARFNGHAELDGSKDIPLSIPLEQLPPQIKQLARPILERLMAEQEALASYLKWKPLERKIVPGTITEMSQTHFKISLKGGTGILNHRDGIKKEPYTLGATHLFHIKRVRMEGENVRIRLLRAIDASGICIDEQIPQVQIPLLSAFARGQIVDSDHSPQLSMGLVSLQRHSPIPGRRIPAILSLIKRSIR